MKTTFTIVTAIHNFVIKIFVLNKDSYLIRKHQNSTV